MPPTATDRPADHGGGLDAACARYGGARGDWLDLSTGINPVPYPMPAMDEHAWTRLPDRGAESALLAAARSSGACRRGPRCWLRPAHRR
jgi:cobalamin biosynthesis protein CobC